MIHHVGQNQSFSSIQTAINVAADYDTVLVYPGTYNERLKIQNKALTIGSLYLTTGDSLYASQTVIDVNFNGACLYALYSPYVKIAGFTFQHATGDYSVENEMYEYSAVNVRYCSNFIIENNIIQYNYLQEGGGLGIFQSSGILIANTIRYNAALGRMFPGGLMITRFMESTEYPVVTMDPIRRNDIYFNTGQMATDIAVMGYNSFDFYLNKFTVPQASDNFLRMHIFAQYLDVEDQQHYNYTCDIREGLVQEIDSDLYVSPWGDDNNSGTSPDQPLKTLFQAVLRIKGADNNRKTIFVEPGIYSFEEGVSLLPLKLKSNINLKGQNGYFTIDGGGFSSVLRTLGTKNNTIEYMKIENAPEKYAHAKIYIRSENFEMNHVIIDNSNDSHSRTAFEMHDYSGLKLNDIHFIGNGQGYLSAIQMKTPVSISNISASNFRIGLACGTSVFQNSPDVPFYLSNILLTDISNNATSAVTEEALNLLLWFGASTLEYDHQPFYASNISLINNNSINSCGSVNVWGSANLNMYNSIINNHYANKIQHYVVDVDMNVEYKNCFFKDGDETIEVDYQTNNEFNCITENIISGNPMLYPWQDIPYMPASNSPLIDAGTLNLPEGFVLPETDLAGNPRVSGNGIDIGAYERQSFMSNEDTTVSLKPAQIRFYPNPLIGTNANMGNFQVKLNQPGNSELNIYNIKGQKVRSLMKGWREEGESTFYWDGKDENGVKLPSGVYLYKLNCDGYEISDKISIIK